MYKNILKISKNKQKRTMDQPQLTAQQYQQILKYMQTTRQQDFSIATTIMKTHNFNLQNAIKTKFGFNQQRYQQGQQQYQNMQQSQDNIHVDRNTRNQEDIRRYMQYLRQKQNRSMMLGIFNYAKDIVVGIFTGITQLIIPEFILRKIYRSKFSNLYKQKLSNLPLKDQKLTKLLKNSYLSRKPIMFIISNSQNIHQCIINLLNRPQIAKKINQSFILSGTVITDKQLLKVQGQKNPPTILICRFNIYEKMEIIKRYTGQSSIQQIDVDKLNYVIRDHQRLARKDRNIIIKYRNYIRRNYYGNRPGYYQQEQQDQQLIYYQRPTHVSEMIKQQNEDYKKIQQQTKRKQSQKILQKQKQRQQQQKLRQIQQQRKVRKMSIPDQPIDVADGIIRFSFRCPDGSVKVRKFQGDEKLDLMYHWVQTNQDIQFQDGNKRLFELLHGYPPSSLSSRKQEKLKEIFESDQEKIIIRQL